MAEAILDSLGPVLTRWTMGGSATPAAPAEWLDALGAEPGEAELRLLALSGHLLGALATVEPAGEVSPLADIPALACPPLPDPLRPRVRRLLQQMREPAARRNLLDFLDARGWTLHPADWMPRPVDDVPPVYAGWQDWAMASGRPVPASDQLTAENWEDFGPAARHVAFARLRRDDPMAANLLIAGKIAGETPDHRVRLLEALAVGLFDADRSFLESLTGDRAPRVKALAASLLARLGHDAMDDEDMAELAGYFTIQSRGLLRRSRFIVAQDIRTPAQRNRRAALLGSVNFDAFASGLSCAPQELVAMWPWNSDRQADALLAAMAARSGSDAVVGAMAGVLSGGSIDSHVLTQLLARLTATQCREAARDLLRAKDSSFVMIVSTLGCDGSIDDAMRTPAGFAMLNELKAVEARPGEQSEELLALGLIASRNAAMQALQQLAAAGLIASDPRLDMLRLNAALEDRGRMQ